MIQMNEEEPVSVTATSQQTGEARDRWWWVEQSIWTERMLLRLSSSEEQDRVWFRLIDKVFAPGNLESAYEKVMKKKGCAGIDGQTVEEFSRRKQGELELLHRQLKEQTYRPKPVQRVWIDKLGSKEKRPLGIPAVRDRVVQGALRHAVEPIFETTFAEHSYGFRPGKGARGALRRVEQMLKSGRIWVVDADLKGYFDSIPHQRLMQLVKEQIVDGRVQGLIQSYLEAGVFEEFKGWQASEGGTPQGAVISPLLANVYLNPLDHEMEQAGWEMVRYADDFVILCQSEQEACDALAKVKAWVQEAGLILHPEKTRIVNASLPGGFDFLGYHFERGMKWPRKKSIQKLKESIRQKTQRLNGQSTKQIIAGINQTLKGWYVYFQHSKPNTFPGIDGYVRKRLRSILRRRSGRKGASHGGADNLRWPNKWFATQGLFSLKSAHEYTVTILKLRSH
jgi:RNA-directed DNA polymerase